MSNEAKSTKPKALRLASFTKETVKGEVIYHPVNRRAHKWAKKVGKRTRLTRDDILTIKASKKVKLGIYDTTGSLKPLR